MMHYVEYKVLPSVDWGVVWLRERLISHLHIAMLGLSSGGVGISFPDLDEEEHCLGRRIRIHGTEDDLNRVIALCKLPRGLADAITCGQIAPVPRYVKYRCVRRVQVNSNVARLQRRAMRRHGLTEDEAKTRYAKAQSGHSQLPYVYMESGSSGHRYRLFVEHGALMDEPKGGKFSGYGFSLHEAQATIPWF